MFRINFLILLLVLKSTICSTHLVATDRDDRKVQSENCGVAIHIFNNKEFVRRGSGILLADSGWVVCPYDLLIGCDNVVLEKGDVDLNQHEIIGINPELNYVIFQVEKKNLKGLHFNEKGILMPGKKVYLLPNSFGLPSSQTYSGINKGALHIGDKEIQNHVDFKANISEDLYGSPVLNENANLVGMLTTFKHQKSQILRIIPIDEILKTQKEKYSNEQILNIFNVLEKGKEVYFSNNMDKSILYFLEVIARDSNYADGYYFLAKAYFEKEEYLTTSYYAQKAISKNKKMKFAYNLLSIAKYKTGEYGLGIKSAKEALKIDYQFARPYNTLGNIYQALKEDSLAIVNYEKAIALNPWVAFPYSNLGTIAESRGEYTLAQKYYKQALEKDSTLAAAYVNLGNIFLRSHNYTGAINTLNKSLLTGFKHWGVYYNLGVAYYKSDMVNYAIGAFENVRKLNPEDPATFYFLYLSYKRGGDRKKARWHKEKAFAMHPAWKKMSKNKIMEEIE